MSGLRAFFVAFVGLIAFGSAVGKLNGQAWINLEYQKKADYLMYFAGAYVTWPADPFAGAQKTFVIGIVGRDVFGEHLHPYEGELLGDRRIVVHRFASMAEYRPCHILYISREPAPGRARETARDRLDAALKEIGDRPVLVLSESDGLAEHGSTINFVSDAARRQIRMEINREAERRAGIRIHSALINLKGLVTVVKP